MVGGERAGQHVHQGGLAGAVFADQRVNLAGQRFEIDGVERERTAEALGYGVGAEQLGGAYAVMDAHIFERGFAGFERAVELMVLDVLQNFLEARPRRKSQLLEILAAD